MYYTHISMVLRFVDNYGCIYLLQATANRSLYYFTFINLQILHARGSGSIQIENAQVEQPCS